MTQDSTSGWSDEQRAALTRALEAMESGYFFIAHEFFEAAREDASGVRRVLLSACAQIAASHHQLTLGRGRAAVRTWHKARAKLASIDRASAGFCTQMDAFHTRLGLDAEGPRFFDVRALHGQSFPMLDAETLHTPSA